MRAVLQHPRALGVAELMNFPGVIAGDPDVLARMVAPHVDGHAPGVRGRALNAYVAAGISTDHEAFTADEALEKRRAGMWVLIREASNARNLRDAAGMVREHGPDYCAFCTDDREPDFLYREGHIDQMCRIAVERGRGRRGRARHGLAARGAGAPAARSRARSRPGTWPTSCCSTTSSTSPSSLVFKDGREPAYPAGVRRRAARHDALGAGLLRRRRRDWVRVIEVQPGQLITGSGVGRVGDPDLAKIAVIERHHATGRVGLGFVRGFGLHSGAFASTVAHDAHNLVVVGVDDGDMAVCAARAQELGGGLVVARDGVVRR